MLIRNDESPAMHPLLHPYGSLVYQAGRGDVHTVMVDGEVLKHAAQLQPGPAAALAAAKQEVARTPAARWARRPGRESLTPEIPTAARIPNPYTYTDFDGGDARHRARG